MIHESLTQNKILKLILRLNDEISMDLRGCLLCIIERH